MVQCRECGNEYTPRTGRGRTNAVFCARECAQTFNNRRLRRGAELYDMFRVHRRERSASKRLGVWSIMCSLDTRWQEEDDAAGRETKSYHPAEYAIKQIFEVRDLQPAYNRYLEPARKDD